MKTNVIIIHTSTIVCEGLSFILQKNYQCDCKSYRTLDEWTQPEALQKPLILVEDIIANSAAYLKFMESANTPTSISITHNQNTTTPYNILINASEASIYECLDKYFVASPEQKEEAEGLSKREIEVLIEIALGYSNKEIADKLFISTHTVMSHRKNITNKLGIKSISGLTVYAIINNYINTDQIVISDLI